MQVKFNLNKTLVLFIPENIKEYEFLFKFPATLKDGGNYYVVAKPHVVNNVIARLTAAKKKLAISKDVYEFYTQPLVLKDLPRDYKFHTEPMEYQHIALRYLYTVGSGGLLLDPGMGKSKVVLDYMWLMQFKKSCIVCPKALLFVWEDEIKVHRPEYRNDYYIVETTDWEKEKEGITKAKVVIVNYNKLVEFKEQFKEAGFDFIHVDEFLIKDHKTNRTEAITEISYEVPYRCGGSGTLINNTIFDMFAPVRYLEPTIISKKFTNFKNHFGVTLKGSPGIIVGFKKVPEARSILESCCLVMTKDKWLKLPDKEFIDIYVPLAEEQKEVYGSLSRNYYASFQGEEFEIDNALVMMSKLYQISNGFLYKSLEETDASNDVEDLLPDTYKSKKKNKRKTLYFKEQPKIEALMKLINERIPGRRAIIWFNMGAEYELIKAALEAAGKTFLVIKGGENKTGSKVRSFNEDPSIQFLLCQAKSVNYGITVLGTSIEKLEDAEYEIFPGISPEVYTEIFYSINFSLEVYLQQQDRIHRLGQKHKCEYYRIFANTHIEHKLRQAITDKMTIRKEMLIDIAEELHNLDPDLV